MRRLLVATAVAVVTATVTAAGCNVSLSPGGGDELGSQRIERFLESDIPPGDGAATLDITKVRCPRRVVHGDTATFTCAVTVSDATVDVHVDQRGDELTRREAVLVVATVETFVQQQYEVQLGVGVTAECSPDALLAAEPGHEVECTATDIEGTAETAAVKVEDLDGTITVTLG